VIEPDAVGIAVDEEYGALVALSLSAPKSYRLKVIAATRLTKFGNSFGVGLSFLYSDSMGEPLKASGVSLGNASSASWTQPSWRNTAEMLTTLRTFSGWRIALHCDTAAQAVTNEVRAGDFEVIEQRSHIVGDVFVTEFAIDVGGSPVPLHFDGNHFPRLGKFTDPLGPVVCNGHERAVEQHHRIAASVDFVVHFESVDRR
jgi:hypothetical protein